MMPAAPDGDCSASEPDDGAWIVTILNVSVTFGVSAALPVFGMAGEHDTLLEEYWTDCCERNIGLSIAIYFQLGYIRLVRRSDIHFLISWDGRACVGGGAHGVGRLRAADAGALSGRRARSSCQGGSRGLSTTTSSPVWEDGHYSPVVL